MSYIRTLFGLLAAGSVMVNNPLPGELLARAARVVAIVMLSAVLVGILLLVGMVFAYQMMVSSYGIAPLDAMLCLLGIIAVLSVLAIITSICAVRHFTRNLSLRKNVPVASHIGSEITQVAQAFYNGLTGKRDA